MAELGGAARLMDWVKSIAAILVLVVTFFAGANYEKALKNEEIAQLKKEYAEASQSAQNSIVEEFNAKQKELEKTLADARARESAASADTERMRKQLSEMSRAAKSSESRQSVRFARLAVRCKSLLDRANTALEFCAKATE